MALAGRVLAAGDGDWPRLHGSAVERIFWLRLEKQMLGGVDQIFKYASRPYTTDP